jgi:hypothetical protein
MFISKKEKTVILETISSLVVRVEQLARSVNALHDVKTISSDYNSLKLRKKTKKEIAAEKRRAYAKAYYSRKKAEKAALTTAN